MLDKLRKDHSIFEQGEDEKNPLSLSLSLSHKLHDGTSTWEEYFMSLNC